MNTPRVTTKQLLEMYGPFTLIKRAREAELMEAGKFQHVLTILSFERAYADLSKEDRPTGKELRDMGETKDTYSEPGFEGCVGHHLVNVHEIYESAKPMPEDLIIKDEDLQFGDEDGLPQS